MSDTPTDTRIFVLYNAKASLLGKLSYSYRKICAPADDSPCAACDLTHGGLKLQESEEWKLTKSKIPATVEQRHIDELTTELRDFVKTKELSYPLVLGQKADGPLQLLLTAQDLAGVSKDHSAFLSLLNAKAKENGVPLRHSGNL
ncbi:hypothetical protein H2198_003146 [Neophaeococcomyces mojaviensis]|uniref:Uncharacterized protein n=1 Tax=Neophaeococcomyces mojaviensis TaxID=3383035 RepID=A0ACC3AC77_9EURO|nr:hypothetical protein H2198_003146 [Knufia sp. JES_112]